MEHGFLRRDLTTKDTKYTKEEKRDSRVEKRD
jgi:hypothetical protein